MRSSLILLLIFCFGSVAGQFNQTVIDEVEKLLSVFSNGVADQMEPSEGNDREMVERLQFEVFDQTAPREERLLFIEKLIAAYKPEFENPKEIAEKVMGDYDRWMRRFQSFGEEYSWVREAAIKIGRIALEPRYYTAPLEGRRKIIRELVDDLLARV